MIIDTPQKKDFPALRALWEEAFGDGVWWDAFEKTALSTVRARCVFDGEIPVSALYWLDCKHEDRKIAYLYAVATAKSHRGQGLCRRLLDDTHQLLAQSGYAGAILVPSEPSLFDFYQKNGYQTCAHIGVLSSYAAPEPIALQRIDKHEYAACRRSLLPVGGVIQEREHLDYLETMANFYRGADFLLAAQEENGELFGLELLGNADAAPKILRALGFEKGSFRIPSDEMPFAMYRPLTVTPHAAPTYFGLAFD